MLTKEGNPGWSEQLRPIIHTTANDILGRVVREPDGLSLATAPMHIGISQRTKDFTDYFALIDHPLDSDGFFGFLHTVAPSKDNTENLYVAKDRTEKDWEYIDQWNHAQLHTDHLQGLGDDWITFMKYKDIFLRTSYGHRLKDLGYAASLWNNTTHWDNTLEGFIYHATKKISYSRGSFSLEVARVDDSDHVMMYADEELRVEAIIATEKGKKKQDKLTVNLLPETAKSSNIIVPLLRWRKYNNGERELLTASVDGLEVKTYTSLLQDPPPKGIELDPRRLNPVAGFLTVPYLLREIAEAWPAEESLMDGGSKRPIRVAQVSASALRRKNECFQSQYFPLVEKFADKQAA